MTTERECGKVNMAKVREDEERQEPFEVAFCRSWVWRRCAAGYKKKVIYCERCAKKGLSVPGVEVHHKIRLTPDNVNDPEIALNWDNLELLCLACHKAEHAKRRWRADAAGHVELPPC